MSLLDWLLWLLGIRRAVALRLVQQYPGPWQVELVDARGRRVAKDGVWITATATNAVLTGRLSEVTNDGVAVFRSLTINPMGDGMAMTLTFSSANLASAVSDPITLTPVASALQFVTPPPASAADAKLFASPVVLQLVSAKGVAVAQSGVTVSVAASNGGLIVGPATQTTDSAGRVAFPIGVDDPAL